MGKREAEDFGNRRALEAAEVDMGKLGAIAEMSSTVCLTMSEFKNIGIVFKFSGLEGCNLLLSLPEVVFPIDCRLRNVGTKIHKYQKIHNTIFP